ncbi:MAG TPA: UbiX family flavin prenyltransferase [Kiloniellales bacterium]|nr:UbiX family flavin prenyltransferase [Kiloniellales bacterium]
MSPRRLIVGITGASGAIYGVRILQALQGSDVETHLVMSESARMTLASETDFSVADVEALATQVHSVRNIGATVSSGSFKTLGMVIAPCSIRTLSDIAWGTTGNLMSRAADVVLKERRRLVLMLRETPLTTGHIRNMLAVSEMGGIVAPPVPAFYARPATIDDLVRQSVGRVLDLFDLEAPGVARWGEDAGKRPRRGPPKAV